MNPEIEHGLEVYRQFCKEFAEVRNSENTSLRLTRIGRVEGSQDILEVLGVPEKVLGEIFRAIVYSEQVPQGNLKAAGLDGMVDDDHDVLYETLKAMMAREV
jgi:hypothetical protein